MAMDGAARVNVYLELKGRLKSGLDTAKKHLNQTVQDMKGKLNDLKTKHIESFRAMSDEIPGFGRAMRVLGNPFIMITAGLTALAVAFATGSRKAQEFDTAMAKANTTAQMSPVELKKTKQQVLDYAANSDTANATMEAPKIFDIMLSSGLDKETSLKSIPTGLKAMKAGFVDAETAARAFANVMNSSGIKDVEAIADKMAMVKNKGNAEFQDIANYLPKIVPAARTVGLSLDEVGGAYAYLTAQGQTAERSATLLENAFKVLGDPEKAKNFKKLGIEFYDAQGKIRPLTSIVDDLGVSLAGLSDKDRAAKLEKLGMDTESAAAFANMTMDVDKLKDSIDSVTNSQGELSRQYEAAKTPMDGWVEVLNWINRLWINLGDTVNAVLGPIGTWLAAHKDLLEVVGYLVLGVAVSWGAYTIATNAATIAQTIFTAGQWLLNAAMAANPVGIIVTTIGLLIGGLVAAYKKSETFRAALSGLMEVGKLLGDVFIGLGKILVGTFTLDIDMVKEGFTQNANAVAEIFSGGIKRAFDKGYKDSIAPRGDENIEISQDKVVESPNMYGNSGNKKNNTVTTKEKDAESKGQNITGSQQVRNITIQKLVFIEGDPQFINQQLGGKSQQELERWFIEMAGRVGVNLARSYN